MHWYFWCFDLEEFQQMITTHNMNTALLRVALELKNQNDALYGWPISRGIKACVNQSGT